MISLRQHLLTLVAVFAALAIGVVLGGGPLSEVGRASQPSSSSSSDANAAGQSRFADAFAQGVAGRALAGTLRGQTVALVTLPGAAADAVTTLTTLVKTAGGTVTGRYVVGAGLLDPTQKTLVDTLGSQLVTSQKVTGLPAGISPYARIGHLLGLGLATTEPTGAASDARGTAVLQSLAAARMTSGTTSVTRRAGLVLVVLGSEPAPGQEGSDVAVGGLVEGLAGSSRGAVLIGTASSGRDGLLAEVRDDGGEQPAYSTVDSDDTTTGLVTSVLALSAEGQDRHGSYGASGSDGAVPAGVG